MFLRDLPQTAAEDVLQATLVTTPTVAESVATDPIKVPVTEGHGAQSIRLTLELGK